MRNHSKGINVIIMRPYLGLFNFFYYISIHSCVPQYTCGDHSTTCNNGFSPSTTWVPGIKLRGSDLTVSITKAIPPAPNPVLKSMGYYEGKLSHAHKNVQCCTGKTKPGDSATEQDLLNNPCLTWRVHSPSCVLTALHVCS